MKRFVRAAIRTWLHLLVVPSPLRVDSNSESTGAVRSSLFHIGDPTTGQRNVWMGFPVSIADPSAHEAVLEWYAGFVRFVETCVVPARASSPSDFFREYDSRTEVPRLESSFENFEWNCNQAAQLAAVMDRERRILYQSWQHDPAAAARDLPESPQLWQRDRRLSVEVIEAMAKLGPIDRDILTILRKGPLCDEVCGGSENAPGYFNKSVGKLVTVHALVG